MAGQVDLRLRQPVLSRRFSFLRLRGGERSRAAMPLNYERIKITRPKIAEMLQ